MLNLKRRLAVARQDDGFTLIELAVVILIIGILLAVAIPTFLGVRKNAQNKAAQSSVRNALTNAKTLASDSGTYSDASVSMAKLQADAPDLTIVDTTSTGAKIVSYNVTAGTVVLAAKSQSGDCYMLRDNLDDPGSSPSSAASTQYLHLTTGDCNATTAPTAGWSTKW